MNALTDTAEQSRADATRARLLEAAISAFAERGFHGTTTRDIATAAGLSPAALYVHHRSKEELLYLISRAGHDHVLRLVRDAMESSDDATTALRRAVHDFVASHARDHTRTRVVNYELAALSPEHLAEIRAVRHQIEQAIRQLIERGVAAGVFDTPDPRMAGAALMSLGIDLGRWYRNDGGWSPEHIATRYAEMALRIVGARPATS
ncbi:TetR family transcriptional regulator [Micromonospora soli]|uniref:TetR family transcriptional regulator n=1 Tax=Micromonospora sp. NBRC 110009 TaxID=3061627 RepID=UPI0026736083|nr:TetR family transcriptional regulator [Micromonospora sp. NBRC 110009]WKT97713.1 TetR family transcriptional regulator [Micromonospora sp. NBRC 110009]